MSQTIGSKRAAAGKNRPSTSPPRRILVVDDHVDSATSLSLLLGSLGHDVRTAHDGLEAIETAQTFRPDVVFLDIGMPRLDGYETARRIRRTAWGSQIVLVALTGWGQDEDRIRSEEAGFNFHLVKPLDFANVQTLMADITPPPPASRSTRRAGSKARRGPGK